MEHERRCTSINITTYNIDKITICHDLFCIENSLLLNHNAKLAGIKGGWVTLRVTLNVYIRESLTKKRIVRAFFWNF